jgi:diguanylate cyclase (GGDEF)-like protein
LVKVVAFRVVICWLALVAVLHSQQYVFNAYQQAQGLKNLSVNALAFDGKGFLWLATENGAYRFVGSGFERFGPEQGIEDPFIRDIVVDSDDTVWAGTSENLYRWDGQRFHAAGKEPIHVWAWNHMVVEDNRHLLIVENKQVYRFEHDRQGHMVSNTPVFSAAMIATHPDLKRVASLSAVRDSRNTETIWVGSEDRLYSWSDEGTAASGHSKLVEWDEGKGLAKDIWDGVELDRAGTLWAGGRKHIAVLEKGRDRFEDRSIPGTSPGNTYHHTPFVEDRQGRVLVPSEDGIARWDGKRWATIGEANGLRWNGHIGTLLFDETGDLWIGTRGDGLFKWAGYDDWEGWNDAAKLRSGVIWSVTLGPGGRVFVGTDKGPAWIDPATGASGSLGEGRQWKHGQVDTLGINEDGSLWGGTFSGRVLRIDAKGGRTDQTGDLHTFITRSVPDAQGRVFFTGNDGIYMRAAGNSRATPHRVEAVNGFLKESTQVDTGCRSPDGTVWFLANKQVIRWKDGQWSQPAIYGMPRLPGLMLDMSCAADGAVWVTGQQTGTWRLRPQGDRLAAWQLRLPSELLALDVVAILVDRRGWVWLGTDAGLLAWNGSSWRHLTEESGLIWEDVNQGAMVEGADGSLWIGTSGGVAHLMHPEDVFEPVKLREVVTEIRREDLLDPASKAIKLGWSSLPLEVQFASPLTRNRSELIFKYRMAGLQTDWVKTEDGRAMFYDLPPGDYTLTGTAEDSGLSATSAMVAVQVTILPPWWRTWWFYVLCGVVFAGLAAGVDRVRARHLRAKSRQLEQMVRDRTQELETSRELLRKRASEDGLTGLLNHESILRALDGEMARARREGMILLLAMADLDHFKRVNDAYGHLAGDQALRRFADAIRGAKRSYDHAGRYGGEEFLIILTHVKRHGIEARLQRLQGMISGLEVVARNSRFKITCSMGATIFDPDGELNTAEALLTVADQALYEAKGMGRNRAIVRRAEKLVEKDAQ